MNNLVGSKGDIFWDLPPWITYPAGSELACVLYVANPTDTAKEYALLARLKSGDTVISEEAITVYGYSWFSVDPGDFIRLFGAMKFDQTNVTLTVSLIEKENDEETDSVSTMLLEPTAAQWPPGWPGALVTGGFDWTSLLMLVMLGTVGIVMVQSVSGEEKPKELPGRKD